MGLLSVSHSYSTRSLTLRSGFPAGWPLLLPVLPSLPHPLQLSHRHAAALLLYVLHHTQRAAQSGESEFPPS